MSATLLAIFRRPDGGEEALATFLRRYHGEHLPLIDKVPGLIGTDVERVAQNYAGDDIVVVTRMTFANGDALETGMASDEMRAAGRNLREIAPGMLTLVRLEDDPIGRWNA